MDFWTLFPLVLLFILFFMKVPVAHSLLISTLVYFLFSPTSMSTDFLIQRLTSTFESFVYLAIPFFTCAGVAFNYSGITVRLMGLADSLVGHMRGGLAQCNIVLAALMGGLSGSANADAAMQSKILVPQMVKSGIDKPTSAVITASASVITPIIPPGIILILYATCANVSIASMFYAGYLPGILIMVALMLYTRRVSRKRQYPATRESRAGARVVLMNVRKSLWALFVPLGIILGLRFGIFTPTEAGAICVVYAIFVGKFIYKEMKFQDILPIITESVEATAGIMYIIGAASAFGLYLTWEGIPMAISNTLVENVSNPYIFLLLVNILLIIIGCFFEGSAAMILLAPLLVPVAVNMGI
jgi:tripartite ATP-independent transporter DctM subunit